MHEQADPNRIPDDALPHSFILRGLERSNEFESGDEFESWPRGSCFPMDPP